MNDYQYLETLPIGMRSPQWRWQIALAAKIYGQRSTGEAIRDHNIRRYVQFLDIPKKEMVNSMYIQRRFPDIYLASEINNQSGFGRHKWMVEALIMGRCTSTTIAKHLVLGKDGVKALCMYKQLYFDVEPLLDSPLAVFTNVLSGRITDTDATLNCDYLWKAIAYAWGWRAFVDIIQGHLMPMAINNKGLNKRLLEWQKKVMVHSSINAANNFQQRNLQNTLMLMDKARETLNINTQELDKSTGDRPEMAARMVLSALQTALMERPPPPPFGMDLAIEPRLQLDYSSN